MRERLHPAAARARTIDLVPEDGQWTARHRPTGVASCGDTPAEALGNLRDAVRVYRATVGTEAGRGG